MKRFRKSKAENLIDQKPLEGRHTIDALIARMPVRTEAELSEIRKEGNRATAKLAIHHRAVSIERGWSK